MNALTNVLRIVLFLVIFTNTLFAANEPKVFRVRALGDPQTLDWNRAHTWMDGLLIYNLMEGLVGIDSKNNPVPNLAQKWQVSGDAKTYTFTLRKGVVWSDGLPLKAQHFVDSWKRLLTAETAARYAHFLFDIEGAEEFYKGKNTDFEKVGVHAVNDQTLQVKLKVPVSHWHWILTSYVTFPIRLDLIQKNRSSWDKAGTMVSIGPFTLATHEAGRTIVLKRNPKYYGSRGNIDEIAIALAHDDATALGLYEAGQLDFLAKISPLERKRLKSRPDFKAWPELRTVHLAFNTEKGPTQSSELRRAIAMSVDRKKLDALLEGAYQPATSFVPPGLLGYFKTPSTEFSPDKAKALLKSANIDPATLPPLDLLTVAFDDQVIVAQFIQDELKRNLGLNVRTHFLEPKRYYSPLLNHDDYAMQINLWAADFPDPDNFYSVFLSSSKLNRYPWKNTKYDELVLKGRVVAKRTEREQIYLAAQKILLSDATATLPLYYGKISGLIRQSIKGFNPGPMSWWQFKDLWLR